MATTTTNLGLTKPAYADTADIAVINGNMDTLDTAVNAIEGGLAIISNNNTHAAVSKGQYVYVRNHGTLSEGMYKANSNIAANGTLSSSNLTAVSGGLGADVATLNDKLTNTTPTVTKTENIKNNSSVIAKKYGNIVSIYFDIYAVSNLTGYVDIASLAEAPGTNVYFTMIDANDNGIMARLTSNGVLQIHGTVADRNYMGTLTYVSQS